MSPCLYFWIDKAVNSHLIVNMFFCFRSQIRLADLERQAVNETFVILSDIWLDDEEVCLSTIYCAFSIF